MKETKVRSSNFELLRLFAMLFIVAHHMVLWGFSKCSTFDMYTPVNKTFFSLLLPLGKLGVALFLMLTGYFAIKSSVKLTNFIKIYFQTWIYSVFFLIVALCYNSHYVELQNVRTSLMPIVTEEYWFVTSYLILYMLIPIINKVLAFVEAKKCEKWLLLASTILFLFVHTNIIDFIYYYILGAYFSKGVTPLNKIGKKEALSGLIVPITIVVYYGVFKIYPAQAENILDVMHKLMTIHSPFVLVSAIFIFGIFKELKIKPNPIINSLALSAFPVYLIHENLYVRPFLWKYVYSFLNVTNHNFTILFVTAVILIVFFGCIFWDKIFRLVYLPIQKVILKIISTIFSVKVK